MQVGAPPHQKAGKGILLSHTMALVTTRKAESRFAGNYLIFENLGVMSAIEIGLPFSDPSFCRWALSLKKPGLSSLGHLIPAKSLVAAAEAGHSLF